MSYYNKEYFEYQKSSGEFGGKTNLDKFISYIKPSDNIIDFGCGGADLLLNINCEGKVGIEINPHARNEAEKKGIRVYDKIENIEDEWADVIISDNALEHTLNPFLELTNLYPKLKKGGLIIFIIPCESITRYYRPNDVNQHIYSWSPMNAGNLFTNAGYKVISSQPYIHKWPPNSKFILKLFGKKLFNIICKIYGNIERSWFQVRIIATK